MKRALVLFLFLFSVQISFAEKNYQKIVYQSEACTIVEVHDDGRTWYNVIAAITTAYLPETIYGLCMVTVKNPKICAAVYDATVTLIDLRGNWVYKGVSHGFHWVANRGKSKSAITFTEVPYEIAQGIKTVFEAYKKKGCLPWEQVQCG